LKLLLDEQLSHKIAAGLRAGGHDAVTVAELGGAGASDPAVLEMALAEGRVLVTNNARRFVSLVRRWAAGGLDHAGLLLTSDDGMPRNKSSIGLFVRTLAAIAEDNPGQRALENQVRWIP
jgi:predicted nuclease of predicted toxin-antitoxin system